MRLDICIILYFDIYFTLPIILIHFGSLLNSELSKTIGSACIGVSKRQFDRYINRYKIYFILLIMYRCADVTINVAENVSLDVY